MDINVCQVKLEDENVCKTQHLSKTLEHHLMSALC